MRETMRRGERRRRRWKKRKKRRRKEEEEKGACRRFRQPECEGAGVQSRRCCDAGDDVVQW